jgi:hypothetical protein
MKHQFFTIVKYMNTKWFDAPYHAITTENTGIVGTDLYDLLDKSYDQASAYFKKNLKENPDLLEIVSRGMPTAFKIFEGQYPGVEIRSEKEDDYRMAWIIVPIMSDVNYGSAN